MGVIICSFNLNISPKISLVCLSVCYVTESHAYDFVIKDFMIKEGRYLCPTLHASSNSPNLKARGEPIHSINSLLNTCNQNYLETCKTSIHLTIQI